MMIGNPCEQEGDLRPAANCCAEKQLELDIVQQTVVICTSPTRRVVHTVLSNVMCVERE